MRELALHFLDLARNSIEAQATRLEIEISEDPSGGRLRFEIRDNGVGMAPEVLARATDPFFTSRQTRRVGLGLALMRATCERCEGGMQIESRLGEGTVVRGDLLRSHIDCPPLGDMGAVIQCLVCESDRVALLYNHRVGQKVFALDTRTLGQELGVAKLTDPRSLCLVREHVNRRLQQLRGEAGANGPPAAS
jgi:hypothetical protein